jgi:hypothetical protein
MSPAGGELPGTPSCYTAFFVLPVSYLTSLTRCVTCIYQMVATRDERSIVRGEKGHEVGYLFGCAQTPEGM